MNQIEIFKQHCINCTPKKYEFNPEEIMLGIKVSYFSCGEPCDHARTVDMVAVSNELRQEFEDDTPR